MSVGVDFWSRDSNFEKSGEFEKVDAHDPQFIKTLKFTNKAVLFFVLSIQNKLNPFAVKPDFFFGGGSVA